MPPASALGATPTGPLASEFGAAGPLRDALRVYAKYGSLPARAPADSSLPAGVAELAAGKGIPTPAQFLANGPLRSCINAAFATAGPRSEPVSHAAAATLARSVTA